MKLHLHVHPYSALLGAIFALLPGVLAQGIGRSARAEAVLTPEQERILSHMRLVARPTAAGDGTVETIVLSGVNLQLVNGLGATNGLPASPLETDPTSTQVNGAGNLILGYNEAPDSFLPVGPYDRTGSHNLVIGPGHRYSSFGGILAGRFAEVSAPSSSVLGGENNCASGPFSVAVGGGNPDPTDGNQVNGSHAVLVGGANNSCGGFESVLVGGWTNALDPGIQNGVLVGGLANSVSNSFAVLLGGAGCEAAGSGSVVVGGVSNRAASGSSVVVGGRSNVADGADSTVSGGIGRKVSDLNTSGDPTGDWVGGGLWEDS